MHADDARELLDPEALLAVEGGVEVALARSDGRQASDLACEIADLLEELGRRLIAHSAMPSSHSARHRSKSALSLSRAICDFSYARQSIGLVLSHSGYACSRIDSQTSPQR